MNYPERKTKQQADLLKELAKTPIVGTACQRVGISRATFYRWREESRDFEDQVDFALAKGQDLINDLAESKLLQQIQDGSAWAITIWLKRHHYRYMGRAEAPLPFHRPAGRWNFFKQFWP